MGLVKSLVSVAAVTAVMAAVSTFTSVKVRQYLENKKR